jgi:hypothetical protein
MRTLLGVLFIALAAVSTAAGADDLTADQMAAARKVYVAKCAKCHRFYEPKDYQESDWRTWMTKMEKKSKLKPDQAELLNRYLDAYRAGNLPDKPQNAPAAKAKGK